MKVNLKPGETKEIELEGESGSFEIESTNNSLFASQRTDMGAPFDLTIPEGYRERVDKLWLLYDYDSAFKYLIDRLCHYGANGFVIFSEKPEELKFWNEWKTRVNENVPTIVPGLNEVVKWNMKHLSLGGLSFNNWKWGKMKIGKRTYEVPIKWTLHNQKSIIITREGSGFSDYKAGLLITKDPLTEGSTSWAEAYNLQRPSDANNENVYFPKNPNEFFLLRFNSTPSDLTRTDKSPQSDSAGFSLYPTPPFLSLIPALLMRQQLRAMDLNIVDGFINKLIIWKIGDKDFPPLPEKKDVDGKVVRESTISTVKALITKNSKGNVLQLYIPYWITLDIRTPDINPLVSNEKYTQSWIELLTSFGILTNPIGGSSQEFKITNTQNFEQMIYFYREQHIQSMLENVVLREIAIRNNLTPPTITFNPLNTLTNEFLQNLRELAAMGRTSAETLLKYHGLNKSYELPLIMKELDEKSLKGQWKGWSEVEIFNTNTPIRFKQAVVSNLGTEEQQDMGKDIKHPKKEEQKMGSQQPGRPGKIGRDQE